MKGNSDTQNNQHGPQLILLCQFSTINDKLLQTHRAEEYNAQLTILTPSFTPFNQLKVLL